MTNHVDLIIGNTYQRLSKNSAPLDRSGRYWKVHDWQLYIDIIDGNPNVVQHVIFDLGSTFQPSEYKKSSPIPVKKPNGGSTCLRFQTRQKTYGSVTATIIVFGAGGTRAKYSYNVICQNGGGEARPIRFVEDRPLRPIIQKKMPNDQQFGIELELTSDARLNTSMIGAFLQNSLRTINVRVVNQYREGRGHFDGWKIVPDSSIICNQTSPDCNTFELVSPILEGGHGLSETNKVLQAIGQIQPPLKVNKSMGFHVHIDVSDLSVQQLIKVCQNFIKYEDVFDELLPPSRRTGSQECDRYFKSNKRDMPFRTNRERHMALGRCESITEISNLVNPDGRYYKLNMQNLVSGRQPTLEFRQHSATIKYDKVSAWIRLCTALVKNSAKLAPPAPLKSSRSIDFAFEALFNYVIKDRALKKFYEARRNNLENENEACCNGCAHGGACNRK